MKLTQISAGGTSVWGLGVAGPPPFFFRPVFSYNEHSGGFDLIDSLPWVHANFSSE
jgi:hypothetical protein